MTGWHLYHEAWTKLPMPQEAIEHVNALGRQQNMPKTLTFAYCYGFEIPDMEDDTSNYDPDEDGNDNEDDSTMSYSSSSTSCGRSNDDNNDNDN
jgi:hypothetical protein